MKKTIVGLKELRENLETYIHRAKKGDSFTVVRRSKTVFKIVPPEAEELWETVVDFTTMHKEGIPARRILKELHKLNAESQKAPF